MRGVARPRCLHGEVWNACATCERTAWCEDCNAKVELDEPLHPRETFSCEKCVDRMIGRIA